MAYLIHMNWIAFHTLERTPGVLAGVTTRDGVDALFRATSGMLTAVASARQVHGAGVALVADPPKGEPFPAGGGGPAVPEGIPRWRMGDADALATARPGVLIAISVADCIPAVVVDPEHRVVGVAHAGWRGLAAGVLTELLSTMFHAYGTRPASCCVGLGPAIGPCCYRVGPDVEAAMREAGREAVFTSVGDERRLDLWSTAENELASRGVPRGAVESPRLCTSCHPERFFSRRRDGAILGQMWGFALITP